MATSVQTGVAGKATFVIPENSGCREVTVNGVSVPFLQSQQDTYVTLKDSPAAGASVVFTFARVSSDMVAHSSSSSLDIRDFGAVCDGIAVYDIAVVSGSAVINSASALFSPSDVGKMVCVAPKTETRNYWQIKYISQYNSPTQVVMDSNANASFTGGFCLFGTDDKVALDAALAHAMANGGGEIYIHGLCCVSGRYTVPNNVALVGSSVTRPPNGLQNTTYNGSCLLRLDDVAAGSFITLGTTDGTSNRGAYIRGLTIDGLDGGITVQMGGHGSEISDSCIIGSGYANIVTMNASSKMRSSYIVGDIGENNLVAVVGDCVLHDCQIYGVAGGKSPIKVTGSGNIVTNNHLYAGSATYGTARTGGILIEQGAGRAGSHVIANNMIDSPYGPAIKINLPSATAVMDGLSITGNTTYSNQYSPSNTHPVIAVSSTAGAKLKAVTIMGNSARGDWATESGSTWANLFDFSAHAGTSLGVSCMGNVANACANTTSHVYAGTSVPAGVISASNTIVRVDETVETA